MLDNTRLLEQVVDDGSANDVVLLVEEDLHKFTETRRVVVADGLGVT